MEGRIQLVALYALLVAFGVLSYMLLAPFFGYLVMGLLFAFLFRPMYKVLEKAFLPGFAAAIVILTILVAIILPSIWFSVQLVGQATNAYRTVQDLGIDVADESSVVAYLNSLVAVDIQVQLKAIFQAGRETINESIPGLLTGAGMFILGLFLMFLVMYYALKDGEAWMDTVLRALPLRQAHRNKLGEQIALETRALMYGQLVTVILVGMLGGIAFFVAGIPNAVFWAFVMVVLGLIPVLGAPVVYVPGGLWLLSQGRWLAGSIVIGACFGGQALIENVLRPKMVSSAAQVHPVTVILGAIGGIAVFGFVGFVLGPLILSIFFTLLSVDYDVERKAKG